MLSFFNLLISISIHLISDRQREFHGTAKGQDAKLSIEILAVLVADESRHSDFQILSPARSRCEFKNSI